MSNALIGYTGFVGSTLLKQTSFDELFNSKNIEMVKGRTYDLVVCAGAPAVKWKANQNPTEDWTNIQRLMDCLSEVKADRMILISTVDVFELPVDVDEDTPVDPERNHAYGKHRYYLEQHVREHFQNCLIARLPGLFGTGLKKNVIYDFLNDNRLDLIDSEGCFQFYDMSKLWQDLQAVSAEHISVVHFATEPVKVKEISEHCFNRKFDNRIVEVPLHYDMKTKYAPIFGKSDYLYSKKEVLAQISEYIKAELGD
jgi:hypothetical protein